MLLKRLLVVFEIQMAHRMISNSSFRTGFPSVLDREECI